MENLSLMKWVFCQLFGIVLDTKPQRHWSLKVSEQTSTDWNNLDRTLAVTFVKLLGQIGSDILWTGWVKEGNLHFFWHCLFRLWFVRTHIPAPNEWKILYIYISGIKKYICMLSRYFRNNLATTFNHKLDNKIPNLFLVSNSRFCNTKMLFWSQNSLHSRSPVASISTGSYTDSDAGELLKVHFAGCTKFVISEYNCLI